MCSSDLLVDGGKPSGNADDQLAALGIPRIDLLIATHADYDHAGVHEDILGRFSVGTYVANGVAGTSQSYSRITAMAAALEAAGQTDVRTVSEYSDTDNLGWGDVAIHLLKPPAAIGGTDQNTHSIGVVVERGDFKTLVSGDSEKKETDAWLAEGRYDDRIDSVDPLHRGRAPHRPRRAHRGQGLGERRLFAPQRERRAGVRVRGRGRPDLGGLSDGVPDRRVELGDRQLVRVFHDALGTTEWPCGVVRVRMGAHVGVPVERADPVTGRRDWFGTVVNRAARVSAMAHGGQVVVTDEVRRRVLDVGWTPLGAHSADGLDAPLVVWQADPLGRAPGRFPPLRSRAGAPLPLPVDP